MNAVLEFIEAVVCAYLFGATAVWILFTGPKRNILIWRVLATVVATFPLMISRESVLLRAIACVFCGDLWFKLMDLAREVQTEGSSKSFRECLLFLFPFPVMQVVLSQRRRSPAWHWGAVDVARVIVGSSVYVFVYQWLTVMTTVDVLRSHFLLDHFVKVWAFVVAVEAISQFLLGLERLSGYETTPIIRYAFVSHTVGEFWYRYNTRIHSWMYENVFVPAGGVRHPIRGVIATFFVSALIHEVGFDIATSRIDGYQFTFFMIQAPAAVVSRWLDRSFRRMGIAGTILAHTTTIAWFVVSSILFFDGVNRVFPVVYASRPWLP